MKLSFIISLIYVLVKDLDMYHKTVKYIIRSKRDLKGGTFNPFIKYLFDNFEKSQAKKLANSFIGNLAVATFMLISIIIFPIFSSHLRLLLQRNLFGLH